jgi:hypothetical protein
MKYATFIEKFKALLHTRLRRFHNFTEIEANNEVYYIANFIGVDALLKGTDLKYGNRAYVFPRFSRLKMKYPMKNVGNRANKIDIALTINNALDSAEFEVREIV